MKKHYIPIVLCGILPAHGNLPEDDLFDLNMRGLNAISPHCAKAFRELAENTKPAWLLSLEKCHNLLSDDRKAWSYNGPLLNRDLYSLYEGQFYKCKYSIFYSSVMNQAKKFKGKSEHGICKLNTILSLIDDSWHDGYYSILKISEKSLNKRDWKNLQEMKSTVHKFKESFEKCYSTYQAKEEVYWKEHFKQ